MCLQLDSLELDLVQHCEDLIYNFQLQIQWPGAFHDDALLEGLLLALEVVLTYCVLLDPLILHVLPGVPTHMLL